MKEAFPLIDLVGVKRQHEGEVLDFNTVDGQQKQMQYLEHSFQTVFQGDEFETLTIPAIFERFRGGATEMAASIAQAARDAINTATEEVGNVVKTTDLTGPENLLTMLETVQVDFCFAGTERCRLRGIAVGLRPMRPANRRASITGRTGVRPRYGAVDADKGAFIETAIRSVDLRRVQCAAPVAHADRGYIH